MMYRDGDAGRADRFRQCAAIMSAQHLTDAAVKRLALPTTGSTIEYDDKISGFGVRLTANGARSFILRYRVRGSMRDRTYTIGATTVWRVTEARAEAKPTRTIGDQGEDPFGEMQAERDAPTVGELCERFIAEHLPRVRASTAPDYSRLIRNHVRPFFGERVKVADVRFDEIDRLHRKITETTGPYAANRGVAMLSKMFSLSIRWEMRANNPCKGIGRNYETKRKRYLAGDELARLTAALAVHPDRQAADVVRLLLFTGCRKGEALAARWADIDLASGVWTKPGHTVKQRTDHVAPLSAPARALLSGIREEQAKLVREFFSKNREFSRWSRGTRLRDQFFDPTARLLTAWLQAEVLPGLARARLCRSLWSRPPRLDQTQLGGAPARRPRAHRAAYSRSAA